MAWSSLSTRLQTLPLVLAGPILRRVEKDNVSVWVALKEKRELTLEVYDDANKLVMTGHRSTVSLGVNLHIAVVTATLTTPSDFLRPYVTYKYTVIAEGVDIMNMSTVSYPMQGYAYPTFSLPADNLDDLRIVHASCRKLQAEGYDAFVAVEDMIQTEATTSNTFAKQRPHQLFLTGDQIYADDVDGLQLFLIIDALGALLGWQESLPAGSETPASGINNSSWLAIGARAEIINRETGFKYPSSDAEVPANHLLYLGEFFIMYLFMWSPVLWPQTFADYPSRDLVYNAFAEIVPTPDDYEESIANAVFFRQSVVRVQVALANVPTYMICDDHEITDDWFLNLRWCKDVLASPLGTRIVQNGLTAYALFQAWGNTPTLFQDTEPGGRLLDIMPRWAASSTNYDAQDTTTPPGTLLGAATYWQAIHHLIGMPDLAKSVAATRLLPASAVHLTYNYHIDWGKHEVFVLDTRNERAYPWGDDDYPALISVPGLQRQLPAFSATAEVTFIVIATPIAGVPNIEDKLKNVVVPIQGKYFADAEAYAYQEKGIQSLYAAIAANAQAQQQLKNSAAPARVVVLSGDVHYGFTTRVEFWGNRLYGATDKSPQLASTAHFVLAQLCASALKNEKRDFVGGLFKSGTNKGHEDGYTEKELNEPNVVMGWTTPTTPTGAQVVGTMSSLISSRVLAYPWIINDNYPIEHINDLRSGGNYPQILAIQPDWRYRTDYLVALAGALRPGGGAIKGVQDPANPVFGSALDSYLNAASNAQTYVRHDGFGREVVGKNNLGEVRFSWGATEETKIVKHQIWWRLEQFTIEDKDLRSIELPPYPLSAYEVILGQVPSKYPAPTI
ncbi:MAG: hypothetical protein ACRYG7_08755 [Janthinobacterium lividum]